MRKITSLIRCDKEFSASVDAARGQLSAERLPIIVNGLTEGAEEAYVLEACKELSKTAPVLLIVSTEQTRDKLYGWLAEYGVRAYCYKKRDFVFHNMSASHDTERERLSVLSAILSGECDVVVTTADAAADRTVPSAALAALVTDLAVGGQIPPEELCRRLETLGYARCDTVESDGQYARRGGIVDFYPGGENGAIRVEFFGDEIDRIARFDPITQRAIEQIKEIKLAPAIEVMLDVGARERVGRVIRTLLSRAQSPTVEATLKRDLTFVDEGLVLPSRDKYLGVIYESRESLMSYFASVGGFAVILGTAECERAVKQHHDSTCESAEQLVSAGLLVRECIGYTDTPTEYKAHLAKTASIHVNSFSGASGMAEVGGIFGFRCKRTVCYGNNPAMLVEDVNGYLRAGYRIIIESETRQGTDSVRELLLSEGISPSVHSDGSELKLDSSSSVRLVQGTAVGFDLISLRIAVLSMAEDTGRAVMKHRRSQRMLKRLGGAGQRIMSYAELEVGDYVVHANYGIGQFEGIQSVRVDGVVKDYITIRYAGTDKLYVPCDRLEMVGKYIGARESDGSVKLSRMGGADWHKAKSRAKSAARDIAKQLIALYAERKRTPGFSFPEDSELEEEFASDFEYLETDSQLAAIADIKRDMISPSPMNRLLCGDVGFGKTEVALRAAFKAIMGGKQVAILVPTTILALQHYTTALSRMRGYPVTVEMLSRFRTPREQARITKDLAAGKIDILIGTHKLLGKKIEFRDLGLLIVDEEQRFGVLQKEKLKERFASVDVLTLSATPIPRTLNMAINGISDMSVLDEAPENRRPVQTYVLEHDEIVILDAIRRELARAGQVLYLYNNIDTISYVAAKISESIPEARVAYAHGRMEKDELEDIWQMLVSGEIDVLVCTTIIETGVDLPSANTLIIENADRMGLSQLHQIRGRVGRSERQAYAYFTYRPGKALSDIAKKRLQAIKQYAEFGAGFRVALCDLEIRGAGNLLGAEQHGYIDSVGYDLYVKLLSEAVLEERGEVSEKPFESNIDIKIDAHIPEYYVERSAFRMEIYKKMSHVRTVADLEDLYDELTDRFGEPPKPVVRLLNVALCRALAEEARIPRVELRGLTLLFHTDKPDLAVWSMLLDKYRGRLIGQSGPAPIAYKLRSGEDPILALSQIMQDYYKEMKA